jgi:hydroxymethylbilane synthase
VTTSGIVRIGTRGSALALWQARHVAAALAAQAPDHDIQLVEIVSTGDRVVDVPLSEVEGTGFFTATLDRALRAGDIDLAVHSHKDVPVEAAGDLVVAAVPPRGPVEDVLCARDGLTLSALPPGARVGTCSLRRTAQVLARRPDLVTAPLRGNVPTRVGRVAAGEFDAVVLARAGLTRLGLDRHVTEVFAAPGFLPAPAQGALAVHCRVGDAALRALAGRLDHAPSRRAVEAERAVLHALGGGCSVPVGALAACDGGQVTLIAAVFDLDGAPGPRVEVRGGDPGSLGAEAARRLLHAGAGALLEAAAKSPRLAWAQSPEVTS